MKITKRVLALVVAALMIFSTFAVAASAATSVQAMIDAAEAGSTVTLTKSSFGESITINKDITLDLGGYTFEGAPGKNAITTNNANVVITNGFVRARFANVDSWTMLETVTENSPTAIRVYGGSIELNGVRAVGSYTRVPTTTEDNLPTGTALAVSNGATAVLKQAALLGDYAINNKVTNAPAAGTVTVYDSLLGGWIMAVKGGINSVTVASGYTMNNLKDYAANVLANGKTLNQKEQNIVDLALDSRFYFSYKNITEKGLVTVDGASATVTAEVIDYQWKNSTSTDCSYKYVPTYAVLSDGTEVRLDGDYSAVIDAALAEDVTIKYRVLYDLMPDFKLYLTNAEKYIEELYNKVFDAIDEAWVGYVDTYNEYVEMLANGNYTISRAAQDFQNEFGVDIGKELFDIRYALLEIGGQTMFDPKYVTDAKDDPTYEDWGWGTWNYYFVENGTADVMDYPFYDRETYMPLEDTDVYGILDVLEKMNNEIAAFVPFSNQDNWDDIAAWLVDNYKAILDFVPAASAAIADLKAALDDEQIAELLEYAGMGEYLGIVDELEGYVEMAQGALDEILAFDGVQELFKKIDTNKELVPQYATKLAYIYNNLDEYVYFDDLIADGQYIRTIFIDGETDVVYLEQPSNLDLIIAGVGSVDYSGLTPDNTAEPETLIAFKDTISLTAIEEEGFEFLYWVNTETDRIISTEKALDIATSADKFITAVFAAVDEQVIVLTNPTGDIAGYGYMDAGFCAIEAEEPFISGFKFAGWPEANAIDTEISAAAIDGATTDYYAGNSVFASNMAVYNSNGAIMKINPNTISIIITPKYENINNFNVTFVDGDDTTNGTFAFNAVASATASGDNFAYWTDSEGRIVSVLPTYNYQAIQDSTFTAVYNQDAPDAVIGINLVKVADGRVSFYAERSVAEDKTVLTSGIVFCYSDSKIPTLADYDAKGTAKDTSNAGLYTGALKESTIASKGGAVTAVPYLEIEGEGVIYGTPVTYPTAD